MAQLAFSPARYLQYLDERREIVAGLATLPHAIDVLHHCSVGTYGLNPRTAEIQDGIEIPVKRFNRSLRVRSPPKLNSRKNISTQFIGLGVAALGAVSLDA